MVFRESASLLEYSEAFSPETKLHLFKSPLGIAVCTKASLKGVSLYLHVIGVFRIKNKKTNKPGYYPTNECLTSSEWHAPPTLVCS